MTISDLVMTISDLKHKIKIASFIVASTDTGTTLTSVLMYQSVTGNLPQKGPMIGSVDKKRTRKVSQFYSYY